ncbi:hypothetical protein AGMMS50239_21700 [Bacteroidia bacterium]|nr:hypothetical protein AGMMS50239_21700 [Bacteroidia bacterium]
MKNKLKFIVLSLCLLSLTFACEDMLKTEMDHYKDTDGFELNSPNDTLYSMVGIMRKMQSLADRYVIVGELRGELMDITENANMDLQAIANFDFGLTDKNPLINTKEYYDIINNCNFFIQRADTVGTALGKSVMAKELAAVKTIRAWVYMQLVLNYGKACYYDEPILTVEDVNKIKNNPAAWISDLTELRSRVERSLQEALAVQTAFGNPSYSGISYIENAFLPASLVLGDLYLYTDAPALAVVQYHNYLYSKRLQANSRMHYWIDPGFTGWNNNYNDQDLITVIYTTTENETGSQLLSWCLPTEWSSLTGINCTYQLKPSKESMNIWDSQYYAYLPANATPQDEPVYTTGDLRSAPRIAYTYTANDYPPFDIGAIFNSYRYFSAAESDSLPFIAKYGGESGNDKVSISYIYRGGPLYLRYAEALNRMGKPSLAFAILKYGPSNQVFTDPEKVNPEEVTPLPEYCNFPEVIFPVVRQIGLHSRGSGSSERNSYYVFPETCVTLADSIRFVDERICDELAMETAYEGNRFHDLMRFARYYGNEFLATRVARRQGSENAALKTKLMNEKNWYLPHN